MFDEYIVIGMKLDNSQVYIGTFYDKNVADNVLLDLLEHSDEFINGWIEIH